MSTKDWDSFEVLPRSPWNYGLILDSNQQLTDYTILQKEKVSNNPFTLQNAPIKIKLKAKQISNWTLQDDTPSKLQKSPIYSNSKVEEITMIPLGCARLRMSSLPVITDLDTERTWKKTKSHIAFNQRTKNHFDVKEDKMQKNDNEDI